MRFEEIAPCDGFDSTGRGGPWQMVPVHGIRTVRLLDGQHANVAIVDPHVARIVGNVRGTTARQISIQGLNRGATVCRALGPSGTAAEL